jgi:PAS domain S-box-containing protein
MTSDTGFDTGFATPIALDRDLFMRRLIASLGYLNEGLLGSDVAGAYITNVGLSMGAAIEAEYKRFWGIERPFTLDEYAHVIVDLKQKIQGNFSLVSKSTEKVVVRTTSCPFDAFVRQPPSLCFMTSAVFGGIAARNFGYAKVVLHKRIALGDDGCFVTVHLQRTPEAEASIGREYFPAVDGASQDIGEQLRLMDRLRALRSELGDMQSRWEEIIHGAAEAITVVRPDGRIEFANAQWRDLLGIEGAELAGNRFVSLVHPDDHDTVEQLHQRLIAGERLAGFPIRVLHRSGTWRDVLLSGGPIRDEVGHIQGTLLIARDVTHERQIERLKEEFLTAASHEIRTPITTVKGMTQLLLLTLERQESIDTADLRDRLNTLVQEVDRLALLSRDLLDVARLQSQQLRLALTRDDLNRIAHAAIARNRHRAFTSAGVMRLRFDGPAGLVPVMVDSDRLGQALDHLIANALKYSPPDSLVDVVVSRGDEVAQVRIVDRGIGIPEQDLAKVTAPFTRASNVSVANHPGLGLGLYLARVIVEAHQGRISLTSQPDRGTTALVTLPLAPDVTPINA